MNSKTDLYFDKPGEWQEAINALRLILLDCGLNEELKWGVPCYTSNKRNIVLIHVFKDYCALLFFKGALLQDAKKILVQQTENVQSARQWRFTDARQVLKMQQAIRPYVYEAVEAEKAGLKVELKTTIEYKIPEEFQTALKRDKKLKKAFDALTPGRQRGYLLHFSAPAQSKTRTARIEKCTPQILAGKGLNDLKTI